MNKLTSDDSLRFPFIGRLPIASSCLIALQGLVIVSLFSLFYGNLIPGLVRDWSGNASLTHSFLVPFISGYLIWHFRVKLKSLPIVPAFIGCIPLCLTLGLSLFGAVLGDEFTMRVSMVMALCATVYVLFGNHITKVLLFPLLYLATMIPLPYVLIKETMYSLRVFDATVSESILKLVGIPVYRDAYFLHLPNMVLEVADECSGIATLMALFALALVYSFFLPVSRRARFLLSISAIPFAIIANLFRITITAALTYFFGVIVLDSLFHSMAGTFNFLIGIVLLFFTGEKLRKEHSAGHQQESRTKQDLVPPAAPVRLRGGPYAFLFTTAIFVIALWCSTKLSAAPAVTTKIHLETLSSFLTQAYSAANAPLPNPYQDPKADTSLAQVYVSPGNSAIELFVGYRSVQHGTDRLQSPKLSFPQGWNSAWIKPARIGTLDSNGINANWMLTRNTGSQRLVLYWYQDRDQSIAGELDHRIELFKKQILGDLTDGAVVRIATPLSPEENLEHAQDRLKTFALTLHSPLVQLLRR